MPVARIILGHGDETIIPFETRKRMPPGYTLVTLVECGQLAAANQITKFTDAFRNPDNRDLFENPVGRDELKHMHIYTEGMLYPDTTLNLFSYWSNPIEITLTRKQIAVGKSGIYEFPLLENTALTTVEMETPKGLIFPRPTLKFKDSHELAEKSYKGSIFPTPEMVTELLTKLNNNFVQFEEQMSFSLETIFEKCGPGVYYHVICRAYKTSNFSHYLNVVSENYGFPNYPKGYYKDPIMMVPSLLPYMESAINIRKAQYNKNLERLLERTGKTQNLLTENNVSFLKGSNYNIILDAPEKYQKEYQRMTNIRRKSISQQNKKRRQTRKRKERKQRGGYESHWDTQQEEVNFIRTVVITLGNTTDMEIKKYRLESFYKSIPHLRFLIQNKSFTQALYEKINEFQSELPVDPGVYMRARDFLAQYI